jgi:T-complex protein 1 subunit theta
VNAVKSACKDTRFVAGGGATEIELARQIEAYGNTTPGLDQYAIKKFAEALEIVPRTLAENAGQMATQVISSLYAAHGGGRANAGVDVECESVSGVVDNMLVAKVVDHLETKKQALRLGADAAITVLRVDQIIMAKAAGGPKPRGA